MNKTTIWIVIPFLLILNVASYGLGYKTGYQECIEKAKTTSKQVLGTIIDKIKK